MLPSQGSSCCTLLLLHQCGGEPRKHDQRISAASMLMPMKLQLIDGVTSSPLLLSAFERASDAEAAS